MSTAEQDTALQVAALRAAGVRTIYTETRSGAAARPELERLLARLKPGDVVMVYKLDRIARSLIDLMRVLQTITERGATFRSLTEPIETTTPAGRLLVQMLGAVAEFERAIILERCAAGRQAARDRGVHLGRPPLLKRDELAELVQRHDYMSECARAAGVTESAMRRALRKHGLRCRLNGRTLPPAERSERARNTGRK